MSKAKQAQARTHEPEQDTLLLELTFEQAMAELEQLVGKLESGNLTLDESMAAFQRGIQLARYCATKLDEAESRIEVLLADADGQTVLRPFPVPEEGRP